MVTSRIIQWLFDWRQPRAIDQTCSEVKWFHIWTLADSQREYADMIGVYCGGLMILLELVSPSIAFSLCLFHIELEIAQSTTSKQN